VFEIFWEYEVRPGQAAAFERLYGADGEWARLFHGADGYVETHLFRDTDRPMRYLTVDRLALSRRLRDLHRSGSTRLRRPGPPGRRADRA